jgi:hypothetical protein
MAAGLARRFSFGHLIPFNGFRVHQLCVMHGSNRPYAPCRGRAPGGPIP